MSLYEPQIVKAFVFNTILNQEYLKLLGTLYNLF
jgi:hypothetical protein